MVFLGAPFPRRFAHPFRRQRPAWRGARGVFPTPAGFSSPVAPSAPVWLAPGRAFARSPSVPSLEATPWCVLHIPLTHLRAVATARPLPPVRFSPLRRFLERVCSTRSWPLCRSSYWFGCIRHCQRRLCAVLALLATVRATVSSPLSLRHSAALYRSYCHPAVAKRWEDLHHGWWRARASIAVRSAR